MELTWQITLIFVLLFLTLVSFVWEKIPADLTALTLFATLLLTGLLPAENAFDVFANPAPITVGAMFILSAALEKCGIIDHMAISLQKLTRFGYLPFLFIMLFAVAFLSAFVNNTPVVVVFMPVVLSLAKSLNVPASKLLIPLSFASIFGGTSTLIGTSTNLLVSGIAQTRGEEPLGMFELTWVGAPLLLGGILYLVFFGRHILPSRETLTSILSEDERREYITEAFVQVNSPVTGKTVEESGLLKAKGLRVIEIVRRGVALQRDLKKVTMEPGDRLVLACRPSGIAHARSMEGVDFVAETGLGLEQIAAHEGSLVEGVISPNSNIVGKTIREINFRQRYRMIILAVHRRGKNVREKMENLQLEFGDTLLMLGTDRAINNLRNSEDILLIDRPPVPAQSMRKKIPIVLITLASVILAATLGVAPIEVAAIVGCVVLFLTGCIKPHEGYASIQWSILFLIFGMLAMGRAMEETEASLYLASNLVAFVDLTIPDAHKPLVMLICVYLLTSLLTEILSNNAAAVLMITLALGIVETLSASLGTDISSRPFIIAVAIAASASFSTPIGYQTNTYVYGVGGYRFTDFTKVGLPLNLFYFAGSMILIPMIWAF